MIEHIQDTTIEDQSEEMEINEQVKNLETILLQMDELDACVPYSIMMQRMNSEYNRAFNEALKEDDAVKSKYSLERMKAIAFCQNILMGFRTEIEGEIEFLTGGGGY